MALSRRDFLRTSALTALAAGCSSAPEPAAEAPAPADKPNVIVIMSDDMGYEALGCYGGTSHKTPNLDQLAATGMRFTHAYAQPLCTPTRLQLMTGQYNFRNWIAFGTLGPDERTFGHEMREAGYATCISGKWQLWSYNPPDFEPEFRGLGQRPEDSGFDDWYLWHARHTEDKGSRYPDPTILDNGVPVENTEGKYGPDLYVDNINEFIEEHQDEPFFVYYPMALTHGPFNPPPNSPAWETDGRKKSDPEHFHHMVEYMDKCVGRIVDKLDELSLREKTLVIFFSDNGSPRETSSDLNGQPIQGGKGLPTDAGTRVPLIVNWKGVAPEGKVLDDLIDSTDIYSTVLEAGGATPPAGETIDGVSFLPQIKGQPGNPKDVIIVWHDPRPGTGKKAYTHLDLFARTKQYKLYDDGRFYDVPADVLEENPIPEGEGSPEAEAAREKLRAALDEIPKDKREPEWDPYGPFRQG